MLFLWWCSLLLLSDSRSQSGCMFTTCSLCVNLCRLLRVFSTAKARIYSSLPTWTSSSFLSSSSSSSNVRKKDINIKRMNQLKRFDEWIASRPILIASVTFTIGITLTAVAFLVTGIRVSTEGTFSIHTRRAYVSFSILPYFYLCWPFLLFFSSFYRMERARDINLEQIHTVWNVRGIGELRRRRVLREPV